MKPTLFLLAAGMGSRYGGLKQLDGLGPNGETIMDSHQARAILLIPAWAWPLAELFLSERFGCYCHYGP